MPKGVRQNGIEPGRHSQGAGKHSFQMQQDPPPESVAAESCTVAVTADSPDWAEFLSGRPGAGIYHDWRWGQVMARAYGNRPYYLTARREGRVVGVLQLVHQKSLLFGSRLSSLPYFDASGVLGEADAAAALLARAESLRRELGCDVVELRQLSPLDEALPVRTDKVTMHLQLAEGAEAMWAALKSKVRTKVRKAEKNDLDFAAGGGELLGEFVSVYARTMRDLGSPPHSRRFFRLIIEAFGEAVRLFVVRRGGRPLAASFTLADAWGLHVPWSGSDKRFSRFGANRLLYWRMLAHAADAGCKRFDFGRSTRESGTYEFKQEWGAEEVELYWHYLLPAGEQIPDVRPDSPKFRLMVGCWRRLPVGLARLLGPRIISKLS